MFVSFNIENFLYITKVKFTRSPQTIDPTTDSMLFEMLDKKTKHIKVARKSQISGKASNITLNFFGRCWNVKTKLSQVIIPSMQPSIMISPLDKKIARKNRVLISIENTF